MIERPDRSFYDDPEVHRRYTAHRSDRPHRSPNHVMEEPAVLAEIGDVRGVDVLDLGCGDAAFGQVLLAAGARSYTGVDDSQLMVAAARDNLVGTTGQVVHASIATYEPDPASLDLVTARLSLHYLETVDGVLAAMAGGLRPGGSSSLPSSIPSSPVTTTPVRGRGRRGPSTTISSPGPDTASGWEPR